MICFMFCQKRSEESEESEESDESEESSEEEVRRYTNVHYYLAPRKGLRGIVFTLSVYVSVCLCVCLVNILVFYFSAIRRDIDLKCIQDTHRVVVNSPTNN